MLIIREEQPQDIADVRNVEIQAFRHLEEAHLVDALRRNGGVTLSLVAEQDGQIVGHILFSPMTIESDDANVEAIGLGPLAVLPEYQNQGIGSRLAEEGLRLCREASHSIVFVLGHPNYYPRFGFRPSTTFDIKSEYNVPAEVFMAMELQESALQGVHGTAKYRPEFADA